MLFALVISHYMQSQNTSPSPIFDALGQWCREEFVLILHVFISTASYSNFKIDSTANLQNKSAI